MNSVTLTPSILSRPVPSIQADVPSYNWTEQRLQQDSPLAGKFTWNTMQTFDSKGLPNDSKGDNND